MPLSPFSHLAWFAIEHAYEPGRTYVHHALSRECLGFVLHAETPLLSVTSGREEACDVRDGMVGMIPPDGARHTVVASPELATSAFLLLVPPLVLDQVAADEELGLATDIPLSLAARHPRIHGLLARMRSLHRTGRNASLSAEETARALIVEAVGLGTGRVPDWARDMGVFDAPAIQRIVDCIDRHLANPPPLAVVAAASGLSPGHFARTFRRSTGMSVERFWNHRRILAGLACLRHDDDSIAHLALRLGFSSQSHFTRVFSAWTGMTPSRYRRGFRAEKPGGAPLRGSGTRPPCVAASGMTSTGGHREDAGTDRGFGGGDRQSVPPDERRARGVTCVGRAACQRDLHPPPRCAHRL